MASEAQEYADYLLANGLFEHHDGPDGENLAKKWSSYEDDEYSTTFAASKAWYDEVTNPGYDFNAGGY